MARVKNINGTSDNKCSCNSWLDHWKKFSGQSSEYCSEKSCLTKTDLIGAHVQKANSTDNSWYIIPFCKTHNASKTELEIMDSRVLVSANKKETCEKN